MRVNYYILIELQQRIVLSELKCCLERDQTWCIRIKMFLLFKAALRAVARSPSPHNDPPNPSENKSKILQGEILNPLFTYLLTFCHLGP